MRARVCVCMYPFTCAPTLSRCPSLWCCSHCPHEAHGQPPWGNMGIVVLALNCQLELGVSHLDEATNKIPKDAEFLIRDKWNPMQFKISCTSWVLRQLPGVLTLGATSLDMTIFSLLYPKYFSAYELEKVPSQTLVWTTTKKKPQFILKRADVWILSVIILQNSLRIPSKQ